MSQLKNINQVDESKSVKICKKKTPKEDYTPTEKINQLRSSTIQHYFVRLSCLDKIKLLTEMFLNVRSMNSLAVILNVFFPVNTKLLSYYKIASETNLVYDEFLLDHNRMLDDYTLKHQIDNDLLWFKKLVNSQQIVILIGLMRMGGGNIIRKMYWRLVKIFNEKKLNLPNVNVKKYNSHSSLIFSKDVGKIIELADYIPKVNEDEDNENYNQDTPMNKKVMEGRKNWQSMMVKLKKDLTVDLENHNQPILNMIKTDTSLLNYNGKNSKTKIKKNEHNMETSESDWLQLLPIWIVKKIFSYLDENTLLQLKFVNLYWANISKELITDKKTRTILDEAIKLTKKSFDDVLKLDIPNIKEITSTLPQISPIRSKTTKKKRGCVCKKLSTKNKTHEVSLLRHYMPSSMQDSTRFNGQILPFPTSIPEMVGSSVFELSNEPPFKEIPTTQDELSTFATEESKSSIASTISIAPSIII